MRFEWPLCSPQDPIIINLYSLTMIPLLCLEYILSPLTPQTLSVTLQNYWIPIMYQEPKERSRMHSWTTLDGILGMFVPYWKSRQILFFQITETFSITAVVDKIDILNNQKSVKIYLVPCDRITVFLTPGLDNHRKYSLVFFSVTDLLLLWQFPSVVPVTFASW